MASGRFRSRISAERIVDGGGRSGEVPGSHVHRGNGGKGELAIQIAAALEVAEDEKLVPDDPAADRSAVLVVTPCGTLVAKTLRDCSGAIAVVFEEAAMEGIGSGFHDHVDDGAAGPPHLGIVGGGADIDGRDGVGGQHDRGQVIILLDIVVETLDHEVVQPVQAVHHGLQGFLGVEEG